MKGEPRTYRERVIRSGDSGLAAFSVCVAETDLLIRADSDLSRLARKSVITARTELELHIRQYPAFLASLRPLVPPDDITSRLIRKMYDAGQATGTGPMAAVAGGISEVVGEALLSTSASVIVENGGDTFLKIDRSITMAVYAGTSPFSMAIGIALEPDPEPFSLCTSAGTIGHSLSFGNADAVCIRSRSATLADAAATAVGNAVRGPESIESAIAFGRTIPGVEGILVIIGEHIGAWGNLNLVSIGS